MSLYPWFRVGGWYGGDGFFCVPGGKNDDDASNEQEWADLRGELDTLQEQLQELETDQLEAFEDVIRGFEQTYNELTEQVSIMAFPLCGWQSQKVAGGAAALVAAVGAAGGVGSVGLEGLQEL